MNPYPSVFRNFSYLKHYSSSVLFPVHVTVSPVISFSDLTTCSNLRNCLKKIIMIHFSRLVSTYSHTNLEFKALASQISCPFTRLCTNIEQKTCHPKILVSSTLLGRPQSSFSSCTHWKKCSATSDWLVPKRSTSFTTVFWFSFLLIYIIAESACRIKVQNISGIMLARIWRVIKICIIQTNNQSFLQVQRLVS